MNQNTRRDPRAKVLSMTVRYRSATLGEFIEHHSYDVSRGGMFIKTPSPFPPGTLLKFEVKISGEQRVMQGVGRVVWKRDRPSEETGEPAGMGIKFIKIDDSSKTVIEKLIEARGPESQGAFEQSPDSAAAPKMFPAAATEAELPAPEDRTVMKPATDLLNEALLKTGQSPVVEPAASAEVKASAIVDSEPPAVAEKGSQREPAAPVATQAAAPTEPNNAAPAAKKSTDGDAPRASEAERARAAQPAAATRDEEPSGGRAFVLILVAALVMGGIFFLTKKSSQTTEDAPASMVGSAVSLTPPAATLAVPAPVPSVDVSQTSPLVEKVLVDPELAPAEVSSAAPAASVAPAVAISSAAPVVSAAPVKPKPAVKRPKPAAPVTTGDPASEPAATPEKSPEPAAPAKPAPAAPPEAAAPSAPAAP